MSTNHQKAGMVLRVEGPEVVAPQDWRLARTALATCGVRSAGGVQRLQRADALAQGVARTVVQPAAVYAGLHHELGLAVIVDVVHVDLDRRKVWRGGHRLLDDAGAAPCGEGDVAGGENRERNPWALS
jgi:hypothetical protein